MAIKLKNIISISEARKRIFEISDEVQKSNHPYTLTENGRPKVVMMSASDYDSWLETNQVLYENPNIIAEIKEAQKDLRLGRTISWEKVKAGLNKTHVSNRTKSTRTKTVRIAA